MIVFVCMFVYMRVNVINVDCMLVCCPACKFGCMVCGLCAWFAESMYGWMDACMSVCLCVVCLPLSDCVIV